MGRLWEKTEGCGEVDVTCRELLNEDVNEDEKKEEVGAQATDDGDIVVDYPILNEIEVAVRKLKNNKAPGQDNLPAELLKHGERDC